MAVVPETRTDLERKKSATRCAGVHHAAGATASLVTRSTSMAANALTRARQVCYVATDDNRV